MLLADCILTDVDDGSERECCSCGTHPTLGELLLCCVMCAAFLQSPKWQLTVPPYR